MNVKAMRKRAKLNQNDFWARVGVTQSGGSRYESGRAIPRTVTMLMSIAYGNQAERARVLRRLRP